MSYLLLIALHNYRIHLSLTYAPINSKLQHPPPRAYPGHLTVHRARGGGSLNVVL